jgi:glycosyltransferase involved in cell wall biosynthesis
MPNQALKNPRGKVTAAPARRCWHLITSEYPPEIGGVGDYTHLMAVAFAARGDDVHVWCPNHSAPPPAVEGVTVHRQLGSITPADLRRVDSELEQFAVPRRLLVQWVPHGYRYRSMNLGFCWWVRERAERQGDQVDLIVHEPYLPFCADSLRQNVAALVHRFMTILLLRAARRVWVTIPAWEQRLRPYALGQNLTFQWLPIFSNVPVMHDPERVGAIRRAYASDGRILIGHFGTFGCGITGLLERILLLLIADSPQPILLMGQGSEQYRRELIQKESRFADVLHATGKLEADELSYHLSACDLMIQPYPDGVSSRRGSFMAGLSHGKPIVTTLGELSEPFWTQCGAAAVVPVADVKSFAACSLRLSSDAEDRQRLGNAARELYLERFDISQAVATLYRADTAPDCACGS